MTNVPLMKETLDNAYELIKLIKYSPKRKAFLKNKQEELKIRDLNLPVDQSNTYSKMKYVCPTRLTVRATAILFFDGAKNVKTYVIQTYRLDQMVS